MLATQKAMGPYGIYRFPVGACREIYRCVLDRPAQCLSTFQTPNVSMSWLGLSGGCGVRSTESKPLLRMEPLTPAWCTTSATEHRKECGLCHERRPSQTREHVHLRGDRQ